MRIKVDTRRLVKAIRMVMDDTKRTEVEIVNKALKDVGFRAMKYTPFADPGLIQAQLYRDKIALKLAAKRVAARAGKVQVDRFGNVKLKGKGKAQVFSAASRQAIAKEADRIVRKAVASARACRAGWIPGLKKVGAQIRGGGRLRASGTAAKGTGKQATLNNLTGFIQNALVTRARATGRSTPVQNIRPAVIALQKAVDEVSSDRENYARKKMIQKVLKKHSSR